jgi:hypothetical protein
MQQSPETPKPETYKLKKEAMNPAYCQKDSRVTAINIQPLNPGRLQPGVADLFLLFGFHHHSSPSTLHPKIYIKMRAWSVPFVRPMAPFLIGGAVTFYLINAAQGAALQGMSYHPLLIINSLHDTARPRIYPHYLPG